MQLPTFFEAIRQVPSHKKINTFILPLVKNLFLYRNMVVGVKQEELKNPEVLESAFYKDSALGVESDYFRNFNWGKKVKSKNLILRDTLLKTRFAFDDLFILSRMLFLLDPKLSSTDPIDLGTRKRDFLTEIDFLEERDALLSLSYGAFYQFTSNKIFGNAYSNLSLQQNNMIALEQQAFKQSSASFEQVLGRIIDINESGKVELFELLYFCRISKVFDFLSHKGPSISVPNRYIAGSIKFDKLEGYFNFTQEEVNTVEIVGV